MSEIDSEEKEPKWYILYTNPRVEKKLSTLFRKYKIENYLPIRRERKKWTDRFKWIDTPLFPSYIFVKIIFWRDRLKVLQLPGTHHFVFDKGIPATVSEDHIDTLRIAIKEYEDSITVGKDSVIQKGKFVKVIDGAFKGKILEIVERRNKTGVILRFEALGNVTQFEVKIDDIAWEELL